MERSHYPCSECQYSGASSGDLEEHVRVTHGGWETHNFLFVSTNHVTGDTNTEPNLNSDLTGDIKTDTTAESSFKCSLCTFTAANIDLLAAHMTALHTGQKPYFCPRCKFRTATSLQLTEHINFYHNRKRRCGSRHYQTGSDLQRPMRDQETGSFLCSQCEYETMDRANFVRHWSRHEREMQTPNVKK